MFRALMNDLYSGDYSFAELAEKYNLSLADVEMYHSEMISQIAENNYDDSMDGDFDSAMASAGFGTDEDYGYYGEEF